LERELEGRTFVSTKVFPQYRALRSKASLLIRRALHSKARLTHPRALRQQSKSQNSSQIPQTHQGGFFVVKIKPLLYSLQGRIEAADVEQSHKHPIQDELLVFCFSGVGDVEGL
jgi:hypothetical protein